jgi:predicted O-methyltransferase YrrM
MCFFLIDRKKVFLLFFLFLLNCSYADYLPGWCFKNYDLTVLDEPEFLALKNQVKKYLKKPAASGEKIDFLMDLIYLDRPHVCVEIGVFKGDSLLPTAAVLKFLKQGKIYAIDPWNKNEAVKYLDPDGLLECYRWIHVNWEKLFKSFKTRLNFWQLNDTCQCLRLPSAQAVSEIAKIGKIDFLHIDGNCSKEGSLEDVRNYLPLVRSGGYVLLSNAFLRINYKYVKADAGNLILNDCEFIASVDSGSSVLYKKR